MKRINLKAAGASEHKQLVVPCEFKARDTGAFTGYASIFGNVDLGHDVVERGAFKEFVRNSEGKTLVLWQHDERNPIGTADIAVDEKGLAVEGQLVMDDPFAVRVLKHMKAKTVERMSFGYDVLPGGADFTEAGIRILKALKLWEVSVVTWGMNPLASVTGAKMRQMTTVREFEDFLRDEGGFSNAQAKLLASGGWKTLQTVRDEPKSDDTAAQEEVASLKRFLSTISQGGTK